MDADYDGDGYRSTDFGGLDCDDNNHLISPAAGHQESDPSLCMQDEDADGYGSVNPPDGVTPGTDCDDLNATTYVGAPDQMGDGVDSDCLGGVEFDFDGDGFDGSSLVELT